MPRPRVSTSGGQSDGWEMSEEEEDDDEDEESVLAGMSVVAFLGEGGTFFLVIASQSATEVQERHLRGCCQYAFVVTCRAYSIRFAILAQHDALGEFFRRGLIYGVVFCLLGFVIINSGAFHLPREELLHPLDLDIVLRTASAI